MGNKLIKAVKDNSINNVKKCIEKGADVNVKDKVHYDWTPLNYASNSGYYDIAKYLISKGANINMKEKNGNTPLHQASNNGYDKVVELLLANGADVTIKNNYGDTARDYANNRIKQLIDNSLQIREYEREAEDNKISVEREAEEKRREADGNYINNGDIIIKLYSIKKLNKSANVYVQFNITNQNNKIIQSEVIKSQSPQWHSELNDKLHINNRQVELIEIKLYEKRILRKDKLLGYGDISARYITPGFYKYVKSELKNEKGEVIGIISLDIKIKLSRRKKAQEEAERRRKAQEEEELAMALKLSEEEKKRRDNNNEEEDDDGDYRDYLPVQNNILNESYKASTYKTSDNKEIIANSNGINLQSNEEAYFDDGVKFIMIGYIGSGQQTYAYKISIARRPKVLKLLQNDASMRDRVVTPAEFTINICYPFNGTSREDDYNNYLSKFGLVDDDDESLEEYFKQIISTFTSWEVKEYNGKQYSISKFFYVIKESADEKRDCIRLCYFYYLLKKMKIAHCDVAPRNVLITYDGPVLIDFGASVKFEDVNLNALPYDVTPEYYMNDRPAIRPNHDVKGFYYTATKYFPYIVPYDEAMIAQLDEMNRLKLEDIVLSHCRQ